jgi:hypothetical protein
LALHEAVAGGCEVIVVENVRRHVGVEQRKAALIATIDDVEEQHAIALGNRTPYADGFLTPTNSCPKIVHAATALEMWELRQSSVSLQCERVSMSRL